MFRHGSNFQKTTPKSLHCNYLPNGRFLLINVFVIFFSKQFQNPKGRCRMLNLNVRANADLQYFI